MTPLTSNKAAERSPSSSNPTSVWFATGAGACTGGEVGTAIEGGAGNLGDGAAALGVAGAAGLAAGGLAAGGFAADCLAAGGLVTGGGSGTDDLTGGRGSWTDGRATDGTGEIDGLAATEGADGAAGADGG